MYEKSERIECLCTCAHIHTEFSAQRCRHIIPPSPPVARLCSHLPVAIFPLMLSRLLIASAGSPCPHCQPDPGAGGSLLSPPSLHSGSWHCVPAEQAEAAALCPCSPGCIDMLSTEGQFTFTADQPQLHCATFFIGEPEELITIHYDFVNIDCRGGDFLKVFDGWILKGEKFPSSLDHPLTTSQRYVDFCESGDVQRSIRSSQNVAMIFFRIQQAGNGFTVTVKKNSNLFPCNVISQTPSGRFTMVIPHQHRNCSFSIIYPVVIKISDLILGHLNGLFLKVRSLFPKKILACASFLGTAKGKG
uniref:Corticotropin-releasing factor-binding protein n=1 Tax=Ficedula albicollis TaxID=59894 RepID=A0A803V091_FICAL